MTTQHEYFDRTDGWLAKGGTSRALTRRQWREMLAAWDGRCAYCGERPARIGMEHVEPLSRGGEDVAENIVPACQPCNASKGDRFLLEWVCIRVGLLRHTRGTRGPRTHRLASA